ncbi:hypothetical protein ACO34A_22605 (plasmid) [Rhizobium sp. ACO-34A]|nr:hypothetical protein ACO34A_22605 [Rhizobium sp. ACO-34A]
MGRTFAGNGRRGPRGRHSPYRMSARHGLFRPCSSRRLPVGRRIACRASRRTGTRPLFDRTIWPVRGALPARRKTWHPETDPRSLFRAGIRPGDRPQEPFQPSDRWSVPRPGNASNQQHDNIPTKGQGPMSLKKHLPFAALLAVGLSAGVAFADPLKVAILVPGHANDGAFNQVAREAAEKLAKDGEIVFELREELADPSKSEPVIRQYASRGYDLVIGHGIELSDPILKVAKDFPQVHFAASGGPDLADRLVGNVDGWTYDFGQ